MTDTTGNLERVPVGHRFASGAADALAPVARDLDVVREQVQDGRLHLDPDAAHELLAAITRLQSRVHTLIADGSERIDQPLRFGANFVARAMSERLRGAASGGADAAIPVLEDFAGQLEKLDDIVRRAAGLITEADAAAGDQLHSLGRVD
ncbi:hypothetical protein ACFS2C_27670 [Prauserella oleivorans]|uniref:Uncharacterized protein n=1 Tax=Prauserella oleivorans TaxID=1478153 RepID=A0ABW5WH61_9PSEU